MDGRKAETVIDSPISDTLRYEGREIAFISERGSALASFPAPGLSVEIAEDRLLYYRSVLEYVHNRALDAGRLFDLYDADPDRLLEFLTDRNWHPLEDGREGWESTLTVGDPLVAIEGTIRLLGASSLAKARIYQATLHAAEGDSCLTVPERQSWVGELPIRVAPLRTVLLIGLGETNACLASGLRRLGFNTLLAQQAGAVQKEVFVDLHDQGFPVFEVETPDALRESLPSYGSPDLVIQGPSSDTLLTPEGAIRKESKLDEDDEKLTTFVDADKRMSFNQVSADLLRKTGPALRPLPEAACLEFLLPLLEESGYEPAAGEVEATFELILPTTMPFGEKNRHSTDDVTFRVSHELEQNVLSALDEIDHGLPHRFKAVRNLATGRSQALVVRHHLGPWTAHLAGTLTLRAQKSSGDYVSAEEYKQRLRGYGDVRVIPASPEEDSGQTLLNGTYLQNVLFSKFGAIHSYRPAGVVTPITDDMFQVSFLVPQVSYGVSAQLRGALAASGLAGEEPQDIKRLADDALDIPPLDARVDYSYPGVDGPLLMEGRPGSHPRRELDPVDSLVAAGSEGFDDIASSLNGRENLQASEGNEGLTLYTRPADNLDVRRPRDKAFYLATLLEHLHYKVSSSGRIVRVYDQEIQEIKRLLAARTSEFTPDPETPGQATRSLRVGSMKGIRYRLGSERVPASDRLIQVDIFRADDDSESPRSVTLTFGPGAEDPIVVMPTTVQVVFGFGNICGDLGVLERRLGYRVVAFNRSPNERALNALENGVPLYEFDETLDEQGASQTLNAQRDAFNQVGLALSGRLREVLDNGLVVGETDGGTPVRAHVGHILDGLLGSAKHPLTGKTVKASELYKEILFDEYEARGVPTIYNGSNSPERVAEGRIFVHDAFATYGIEPAEHYEEPDGPWGSLMCVSCNTTNITGVLLRLTDVPELSEMKLRVMTHRKANDQFVGEEKQTVNYQGMAFDFHYHHWADAQLFYDRIKDPGVRSRLDAMFAYDHGGDGTESAWAISTHATGQAATEFHTGVIHLRGKLRGGTLDAEDLKAELAARPSDSSQLIEFPGDEVDARRLLETLHFRIGLRNLYVQPFTVVQDGDDVVIVFFTPHLYNVKPNNLVAALNRDGLVPNDVSGVRSATDLVSKTLGLNLQREQLARYYGPKAAETSNVIQPRQGEIAQDET